MVLQIWTNTSNQPQSTTMPTLTTKVTSDVQRVQNPSPVVDEAGNPPSESRKKRGGLLAPLRSPFKFIGGGSSGKTYCRGCKKKCSGEVLRVNDGYFHTGCFKCRGCGCSLSQGGFFTKDKDYYCADCYQSNYGTKCAQCGNYVEGEVVTALGKTYHQNCFTCAGCKKPFPTGERVTFTGKSCLCQKCVHKNEQNASSNVSPTKVAKQENGRLNNNNNNNGNNMNDDICAGCNAELSDGQALMALDKQYHVWCFKCKSCGVLLHGEYMGKDGYPYCEKDYQALFGVKCTYCRRFISGKVLQAGDNNHFHPTCARCTKCGDPFGDGEEMFLQGAAIWHPRCGPGPDESGGVVINGYHGGVAEADLDGDTASSHHFYGSRASSPGASLSRSRYDSGRFSRSTTHVPGWYSHGGGGGLYASNSTYSLRRPIEPGDRIGSLANINHFHIPAHRRASSSSSRYVGPHTPTPMAPRISTENVNNASTSHYRPISCPPKPGYTQLRSGTPASSAISPGPGMHFSEYQQQQHQQSDALSQTSFRTDYTDSMMRPSNTFHQGFSQRSYFPSRPMTPSFSGEYKTFPLHMLLTSNYKLPPDIDRCNLEKHLSDADFGMAFNMTRNEFYSLPIWRRNDLKRRMKLF